MYEATEPMVQNFGPNLQLRNPSQMQGKPYLRHILISAETEKHFGTHFSMKSSYRAL